MGQFLIDHLSLAAFLGMVAMAALWHLWQFRLSPLAVPRADIDAIADALVARHGPDAEEIACTEEDRAWRRSDTFEQGIWRRVRRELWRRYEAGEWE